MDIKTKFGKKLREIRKIRNYSQDFLAKKSKLSRSSISDTERGIKNISLETIEKLAMALEIDISDFFK